jgi:hypothetical protein
VHISIKDFSEKIKLYWANIKDNTHSKENGLKIGDDLYIVILIILVGTASFGLGKISSYEKNKTPISILKTKDYILSIAHPTEQADLSDIGDTNNVNTKNIQNTIINTNTNPAIQTKGMVVASKSGTKYYYPWCIGVLRIKEENKVWFNSIEEAKSAGLTPASTCTGLK